MVPKLLLGFLVVPLVELVLLVRLGELVGLWPTVVLVVGTGLAGAWLTRREGFAILRRLQVKLAQGQLPGRELLDGAIVLVSGALLVTPGLLTDVAGLLGLLPPSRALARRYLRRKLQAALERGTLTLRLHNRFVDEAEESWLDLEESP